MMNTFILLPATFSASNVIYLLELADRFDCQSLRDRCEAHLMNCVEIPLVHLLNCANFYRLKKLKVFLKFEAEVSGSFFQN
jgi:hypothetical protein